MANPRVRRNAPQELAADVMEETERRMHSTAELLNEPNRSRLHARATEVSKMAATRRATARASGAGS